MLPTKLIFQQIIDADAAVAKYLDHAATALEVGCDPQEVAEGLRATADTIRVSISRLSEWTDGN